MRKIKWVFIGYALFFAATAAVLIAGRITGIRAGSQPRDPHTFFGTYGGSLKTLDPAEVGDTEGSSICAYMFEGLYNYKYKVVPYEFFPELASAMPSYSADGLTITIPIRHGIHYYDPDKAVWPDGQGPEITAADFVFSFKRVCDFRTQGGNYSFIFQDHFVGVDDWYKYTQSQAEVKAPVDFDRPVNGFSVDPADRFKLVLHLTKPYPQIIYNLVNCPCSPVSRDAVKRWGEEIRLHPIGTGAYALSAADNLRDQRITLRASPTYRGRPDIDGTTTIADSVRLPTINTVQLDYFQEEMPAWLLFKQGLLDVEGIPKDAYSQVITGGDLTKDMVDHGVLLRKFTEPSTSYIGFNMKDPLLGRNIALRQAMSMAFDRELFISKFANGRGMPAIGPIPPGFPTFDEKGVNKFTVLDLDAARQLMNEAVRVNGGPIPPIRMLFRGADTLNRQTADFYVDTFKQIGVTVVPVFKDFAKWQEMVDGRDYQMFDGGWSSDYPDEQDFLQLFYSPNAANAGVNSVCYENPEFDDLYRKSTMTPDSPVRRSQYMQLQQMVEKDCPWIIVDYPIDFALSYDWLSNRFNMDYGHGFMQFALLDGQLRTKRIATLR